MSSAAAAEGHFGEERDLAAIGCKANQPQLLVRRWSETKLLQLVENFRAKTIEIHVFGSATIECVISSFVVPAMRIAISQPVESLNTTLPARVLRRDRFLRL